MKKYWMKIVDALLVPAVHMLISFFQTPGLKKSSDISAFIGIFAGFAAFAEMETAINNIRKTLHVSLHKAITIYIKMCISFGRAIGEFCCMHEIDRGWVKENLKPSGLHHIDQSLEKGRGTIIITAHYGNWEMIAGALSALGYTMHAVARPRHLKRLTSLIDGIRESSGTRIISSGPSAPIKCLKALKKNALLGLVADEYPPDGGIDVSFLGRKTKAYRGPEILAHRSGATILPVFCPRMNDGSLRLIVKPPIEIENDSPELTTEKRMKIFEKMILASPWQWAWFQKRWRGNQ